MTPLEYYNQQCQIGVLEQDPQQLLVLNFLQQIYTQVLLRSKQKKSLFRGFKKQPPIKGLYVWGSVGVGKTFLMDSFFECLPIKEKKRMHFYKFMQYVHEELTRYQGKKDPLKWIAAEFAKSTMVLCFDEFFVTDITDAMILGRLLACLFNEGVCIVATSNIEPDGLYRNGLQRAQFLPAIALIKKYMNVLHVLSSKDYRYEYLMQSGFFYLEHENAKEKMLQVFSVLNGLLAVSDSPLLVNERYIPTVKWTEKCAWFNFSELCAVPRCQQDYLVLSERFDIIMLSNVPIMSENDNRICFFIQLVDVLYDTKTKFIFSAQGPITALYLSGSMKFEFDRTLSRLVEMQSIHFNKVE